MSDQGGFVPSPQGGANWYPPVGGYTPVRGSLGVPGMGMASMFPDMTERYGPIGNMMMQTMGYFGAKAVGIDPMTMMHRNMSPIESMYGRQYRAGFGAAVGTASKDMVERMLTSYQIGQQGGGDLNKAQRASIQANAAKLAGYGMTAVQMAPYFGVDAGALLSELPGVSLYQGVAQMRGGTLMPGSMAQRIHQNLMGGSGGARTYFGGGGPGLLSAGERGTLMGALSDRGLLPASPAALSGDRNSPKTQMAMRKLEATMQGWEEVAGQLKGIFGSGKGIDKLLEDFDRALGGSMAGMGPRKLAKIATNIQATMLMNHVSAQYVTETMAQGAMAAQSMGLVGAVGAEAGMSGINIGEGMVTARGGRTGFGMRNAEALSGIMTRRLLGGRASTMSRVAGGTLELMRNAAVTRGVYREDMTNEQLARAMGAPAELVKMVGNLQNGTNSDATRTYFSEAGSMRIAKALQSAGITGTIGEAMNQFQSLTRGSQEMGLTRISDRTLLQAQSTEAFKRIVGISLRRPLMERGITGGTATDKIAAVTKLFTTGAGVQTLDQKGAVEAIAKAAQVSTTTAQSLWNSIKVSAESDPRMAALGGLEEAFGYHRAVPGMERKLGMARSLAEAGNFVRRNMGKDTFIARVMDDLTSAPDAKGRKSIVQRLLGDKSGGRLGNALLAFGNAQEALESGIMTGASGKDLKDLKAKQMKAADALKNATVNSGISNEEGLKLAKSYDRSKAEQAMAIQDAKIEIARANITESKDPGSSSASTRTESEDHTEKNMGNKVGSTNSVTYEQKY